ncbi:class I SAM-dependent methyltransferase [candidate division KSB1 bacterium]|nr:class I SAM-dependent methyltransferase [candidate division KSB1 bacterium]
MARIQAFEAHTKHYDAWFDRHPLVYQSELQAISQQLLENGVGIEIGVGTGRFAAPLQIRYGVEPSEKMCALAARHPIQLIRGVAESLPVAPAQFDFVLMVTTLCFVEDVIQSFREIHRILRQKGLLILGFVDKESSVGRSYQQNRAESRFYRDASFYTFSEVLSFLSKTGFIEDKIHQTLFQPLDQIKKIQPVRTGYGEGSFVVINANKK